VGHAAAGELRRYGVLTDAIQYRPGRMGLYFLTVGAGHRPSEVLYDREGSAFALAPPELIDWTAVLTGVSWLHCPESPLLSVRRPQRPRCARRARRGPQVSRSPLIATTGETLGALARRRASHPADLVDHADLLFASSATLP